MKKLDFLVIGTQKGGTTSLINQFNQHPKVYIYKEEIHFFDSNNFNKNYQSYHNKFHKDTQDMFIGEKTPSYCYLRFAIDRIYEYNPNIKLVFILRDPIKRAYSEWNMFRKNPKYTEDFIESVEKTQHIELSEITKNGYWALQRGYYLEQIEYILSKFSKENLYIGISEKIKKDPVNEYNKIFNFFGLDSLKDLKVNFNIRKGQYIREISNKEFIYMKEKYSEKNKKLFDYLGYEIKEWD
jgi:hypothetical protein